MNKRKILLNLILLLIVLLICYAILEVAIRELGLASVPSFRQQDKLMHHSLIPNSEGSFKFRNEFNIVYKINSLGMRDFSVREVNISKGENEFRIVFVGDSFTEGWGLNYDDTYPKLVEDRLNEVHPEKNLIVFNAGVASSSPIIGYTVIKNRIIPLKPDLVVFALDVSDFHDDYTRGQVAEFDENGLPVKFNVTEIPPVKDFIRKHSYTYNFLAKFISISKGIRRNYIVKPEQANDTRFNSQAIIFSDSSIKKNKEFINKTEHYLLGISKILSENNMSFLLVVYPNGAQLSVKEWSAGREQVYLRNDTIYSTKIFDVIEDFAKENNINFLNTLPAFKSSTLYPLYYSYDPHWTRNGSKVMADAIYINLINNNFYKSK